MLGNAVLKFFAQSPGYQTFGSVRSSSSLSLLPKNLRANIIAGVDMENADSLTSLFGKVHPDVVINCVGLVKQLAKADEPLSAIPINAMLPHRLARLCEVAGARLVHMSTDCVFAGTKGMYKEADASDAYDLYGRSKYLGEVDYPHAITLRTSTIGHELQSKFGLLDWFLSQGASCKGYTRAIFSGLPTVVFAQIVRDVVIPHKELSGLYHVAAQPISKFNLLKLIADVYGKSINIEPDDTLVVDRSLDATRFFRATGYVAPAWPELIKAMHAYQ